MQQNDQNDTKVAINKLISDNNKITRKIAFNKETLRNLVTIASREYFETKLKQDEILANMLDKIINEYYSNWKQNNI